MPRRTGPELEVDEERTKANELHARFERVKERAKAKKDTKAERLLEAMIAAGNDFKDMAIKQLEEIEKRDAG